MPAETESLILKIDNTQALSATDAFTIAVLKAEQAVVLADRQIRALETGFARLASGQDRSNRIGVITARQIESLRTETRGHTQALADNIAKVEQAVRSQTAHTEALARAVLETRAVAAANRDAGESAAVASGRVASMTGSMRGLVQTVAALAGGLSVAVGIRSLISNSASLETAMVGVQKTTDLTNEEMVKFRQRIDDVASRTPVATASLLDIAQAAGQLGVRGVDSLAKFTEVVAKLQSATDIQGGDGAKKLARLIGINGEDVGEAIAGVGAAITRLGNESRASESEILGNAENVAQATAQYRIGSINALALGAAMKSLGTDAEIGGTAVGRSMDAIDKAIRKPGPQMEVLQKLTGQTAEEIANLFKSDPTAQFARFIGGLNAAGRAGEDVKGILESLGLEDIRVARVLPTLGGAYEELASAIAKAREEGREKLALDKEAARAQETLAAKAREAGNVVGNVAERAFRPANALLRGFLDAVRGINAESPTLEAGISSVTSALIALAAARAVAYIVQLTSAMGGLVGVLNAMKLALVSNPITLLAVGAAALIGIMVSLTDKTNDQAEAQLRLNKATEAWAPVAQALADAEAKKKSAELLKDPALESASIEQRIAAAKKVLDDLNNAESKLASGGSLNEVTSETVKRLIQTSEGRSAFDAASYPGSFVNTVATAPSATGRLLNAYVPTDQMKAALVAEIQALEALKSKTEETGAARRGTGADIEAQRAKLQALLDVMKQEAETVGQDNTIRAIAADRRKLEADMTDEQKRALGPLLDQIDQQALLNARATKEAEEAAKANERHAKSIEEIVNAGDKATNTLQGLIDKTQLEIQMLNLSTDERALQIAKMEAERLAAESGSLAGYDLAAAYVAQVEYLQQLTKQKQENEDAIKAEAAAQRSLLAIQAQAASEIDDYLDSLERSVQVALLDAEAAERQEAARRSLALAIAAGYDDNQTAQLQRVADAYTLIAQKNLEARNLANDLGQDVAGVFSRLADSTLSWNSAMRALNDTGKAVLQTFLQYAAIQPLARGLANAFLPFATSIVGGAVGGGVNPGGSGVEGSTVAYGNRGGALALARGGSIIGGELVRYAAGGLAPGVYDSAHIFPMRNGRIGMLGEAGEEFAAKPVRLPNGDYGVRAIGGGTQNNSTVNISVSVDARGNANGADAMRRSARQVAGAVQRGLRG